MNCCIPKITLKQKNAKFAENIGQIEAKYLEKYDKTGYVNIDYKKGEITGDASSGEKRFIIKANKNGTVKAKLKNYENNYYEASFEKISESSDLDLSSYRIVFETVRYNVISNLKATYFLPTTEVAYNKLKKYYLSIGYNFDTWTPVENSTDVYLLTGKNDQQMVYLNEKRLIITVSSGDSLIYSPNAGGGSAHLVIVSRWANLYRDWVNPYEILDLIFEDCPKELKFKSQFFIDNYNQKVKNGIAEWEKAGIKYKVAENRESTFIGCY